MAKLYKLTDSEGYTRRGERNELLWDSGVTHTAQGAGVELCSPGVIHAYLSHELAVLLNPIHASISNPRLWECEGDIVARDGQLKVGCKSLKIIREIPLPVLSLDFKAAFAIHCALAIYFAPSFVTWANNWLSGEDRTADAADAARAAAYAAAHDAAGAAADAAAHAAAGAAAGAAARDAAFDLLEIIEKVKSLGFK